MKETRWLRISLMNANVVYNCNWFLSLFGIRYPVPIKGNRVPMTRNLSPQPQFQSSGFISTKHGMNLARERWSFLLTTNENQRRNVRSCCVGERVKNAVVEKVLGRTGNTGNVTQVGERLVFDLCRCVSLSWMLASVAL